MLGSIFASRQNLYKVGTADEHLCIRSRALFFTGAASIASQIQWQSYSTCSFRPRPFRQSSSALRPYHAYQAAKGLVSPLSDEHQSLALVYGASTAYDCDGPVPASTGRPQASCRRF